ncbi:hypothetical protein EDB80DRAFT_777598 [Ilyonectria destructans]|nr:hypothetical protein EDB80DRAFT_777598 [Ilyonectria destructans]
MPQTSGKTEQLTAPLKNQLMAHPPQNNYKRPLNALKEARGLVNLNYNHRSSKVNTNTQQLIMKVSSILATAIMASVAQAWTLDFFAVKGTQTKKVLTNGHEKNKCTNLRSDYNWPTTEIHFNPETGGWPDAKGYTAYSKTNCKGTAYYGVEGNQFMKKTFKSYKVTG